ncbi:hypothetical protein PY310_20175 [Pseudarthrobacter sp. H3Y2-7]|uniref:hypothetical protein n=1 Tax=Pseudarthrobacter naphthalenicus TaxID=3031328 RepID=UPI0023B1B689|nr:hypothetical protein [Pseudarthrobacter sp. H3Y2-7]MDE8670891.1 hypothetical protein [Pseudarthrobacter sp. H3Y2-7]
MAFKVFEKGSAPAPTIPTVTIQKRGMFSLNDAAFRMIGQPEGVQFLWDGDAKLIAIQGVPLTTPNAYPTRRQGPAKDTKRGIVLIAGAMFTKFIGIDTSVAKRWVPRLEDGMLIVDLNEPSQTVASTRRRTEEALSEDKSGEQDE